MALTVSEIGGVPPELLVGLGQGEGRIQRVEGGFVQSLYRRDCPDRDPSFELGWFDDAPALRDLVIQAQEALILPLPTPGFSPPAATVRTLVGIDTWFWMPEAEWEPVESTVTAGAVTVTATATPLMLRFTPGDGEPAVECSGPGRPWTQGGESACSYTYQWVSAHHASGTWLATVEVDWEVTWASNLGQSGVLEPFTMTTAIPLTVAQAEVVLRLPGG